ncbi:MAG: FkbM family methyltransferase [Hyphomicrobiales bacterium]|nr:FkbM family methyltransferase [Hyphomicrobiales bacterium]MCP5372460.1 FkbM family methyltransferase [Hyphomicrobiales bacterium]
MKYLKPRRYANDLHRQWLALRRARTVPIGGLRLMARHPVLSPRMRQVLYAGTYEREELGILRATLRDGDRVLELGGGLGLLSSCAARRCGDGAVLVVEARPDLIEVLAANHRLNGVAPRVLHGIAGLADGGEQDFFLGADFWSSSTARRGDGGSVKVPVLDVNRLVAEFAPSYLVMDIEGGEADLLPALDTGGLRALLVEVHPDTIGAAGASDLVRGLLDRGFVLVNRHSSRNVLFFERREAVL